MSQKTVSMTFFTDHWKFFFFTGELVCFHSMELAIGITVYSYTFFMEINNDGILSFLRRLSSLSSFFFFLHTVKWFRLISNNSV